jgi:hypothetical protein
LSQVQLPLSQRRLGAGGDQQGHIIIIAEELAALKDEVIMQFSGTKLDKKGFFRKSDPFLVFYKSMESGDYITVHKTEVIITVLASELDCVCVESGSVMALTLRCYLLTVEAQV